MTRTRRLHRLTAKLYREVKHDLVNHPRMTNIKLGKRYGMSGQTIGRIKQCETWHIYQQFVKDINKPKKAIEEIENRAKPTSLFDGEGTSEPVKSASQLKRESVQDESAKKTAGPAAIAAAVAKSVAGRELKNKGGIKPTIIVLPDGFYLDIKEDADTGVTIIRAKKNPEKDTSIYYTIGKLILLAGAFLVLVGYLVK
jgi:hypothetical protein